MNIEKIFKIFEKTLDFFWSRVHSTENSLVFLNKVVFMGGLNGIGWNFYSMKKID